MTDNTDTSRYYTAQYMAQESTSELNRKVTQLQDQNKKLIAYYEEKILKLSSDNNKDKVDKIIFLKDEIALLKSRIQPEDTGHLHTTINVLEDRVAELRGSINE